MAFAIPSSYSSPDLAQCLSQLRVNPKKTCNITKQVTCGLKALYQRIDLSMMTREEFFSNDSEYSIRRELTEGTFSSIKLGRGVDGAKVVIKQVDRDYAVLAYREVILLRHLQAKAKHGIYYFPCVRDFYEVKRALCIVLDAYDTTLYVAIRRTALASKQSGEAEHKPKRQCIVHPSPPPMSQRILNTPRRIRRLCRIAASLMVALYVLRTENIIHADIKPENVFIRYPSACEVSVSSISDISDLPDDFEVHLGDFGNSFHVAETPKFYNKFDLQSLPYRSPEVLLGVPFNTQIDMWSLGIVLLEAYAGHDIFDVASPQALFVSMNQKLTPIPMQRFIGGKFSELFSLHQNSAATLDHTTHQRLMHHLVNIYPMPFDLFHFFCSLLHPDPDIRMNPVDGLKHDFIASQVHLPLTLLSSRSTASAKRQHGLTRLRRGTNNSKNGFKF